MKIAQRFQRWERGPFDNKSVKRTTEKICSCNFKFSGPASRTHLIDSSPNPTDKSGIIYLTPRRASCGAAIRAKPKARLCEPWESQVTVCQPRRGDRANRCKNCRCCSDTSGNVIPRLATIKT